MLLLIVAYFVARSHGSSTSTRRASEASIVEDSKTVRASVADYDLRAEIFDRLSDNDDDQVGAARKHEHDDECVADDDDKKPVVVSKRLPFAWQPSSIDVEVVRIDCE